MKNTKTLSWLFAAAFFTLPFGIGWLTNLLLVTLLLTTIFSLPPKNWGQAFASPIVVFSWAFYFILVASLIYSSDVETGLRNLETKLSFLLAPPTIIAYAQQVNRAEKLEKLKLFIWGNLAAFIALLLYAAYRTWKEGALFYIQEGGTYQRYFFSYETFSEPLMHPGYLATFVGIAVLSAFYLAVFNKVQKPRLWLAVGAILIIEMLMLQGRINLIALILVLLLASLSIALYRKAYKYVLWPIIGILVIGGALLYFAPDSFKDRYLAFPDFSYNISGKDFNSATYRLAEWQCASTVIAEHPIFGVGVGDAKNELLKAYEKNEFWAGLEQRYNAHNQYLETTIDAGLLGLLALVGLLASYLITAFRRQNLLVVFTILFFALCMLTESMLERAWAVILLNVFFPYFLASPAGSRQFQHKKQTVKKTEK